jgi:hypothetical protein
VLTPADLDFIDMIDVIDLERIDSPRDAATVAPRWLY